MTEPPSAASAALLRKSRHRSAPPLCGVEGSWWLVDWTGSMATRRCGANADTTTVERISITLGSA
jgi:hypothetical protein